MEARARKGSHADGLHEQADNPGYKAVQDAREGLRQQPYANGTLGGNRGRSS
jgi:hypothetical protein